MFQFCVDLLCVFAICYGILKFVFWWKNDRKGKTQSVKSEKK